MSPIDLSTKLDPEVQRFTRAFATYVLSRCDPGKLVSESVDFTRFDSPTHVLGFGKASAKMAMACVQELGPRFAGGVVLTPEALIPDPAPHDALRYFGVDHPASTARNMIATEALAQYAGLIPAEHDCIVCVSGGGSAHLCSPKPGVTLDQIIETTNTLNAGGASIHELNEARRSLENLKGGGLADILVRVGHCEAAVLSDVLDDDLNTIASGPMVNPGYPVEHTIIGNHRTALAAAEEFVGGHGVGICKPGISGDSSERGRDLTRAYQESNPVSCLFSGETTVDASGTAGVGGPCMEMTLACALELAESDQSDWVTLGLATDGVDGPTDAAGAVITCEMLSGSVRRLDARRALDNHDTLPFLNSIHATIHTGPTGTNLNDLFLVCPRDALRTGDGSD